MLGIERNLAREEYSLFLVPVQSRQLLAFRERLRWRLPKISILKWARTAEQLQNAVREAWGFDIIVLDFAVSRCDDSHWAAAEVPFVQGSAHLSAVAWEQIDEEDLKPEHKEALRSIFAGEREPLSRPGWIEEAIEWVESAIPGATVQRDRIRQYNAGGGFALVRFAMRDDRACWLKATGAPNRHEFNITCLLAEICPEALPHILASRRDWNAWIMEEAGKPSEGPARLPLLEQAVGTLASLQKACGTRCDDLFAAGAYDVRIARLRSHLPDLIEYLSLAMERQMSTRVPRLATRRLVEVGELLKNACDCLEDLSIPDSLIHNDVNPSNILYDDSRCVISDWCEAAVGNPFLAFEHVSLLTASETERITLRDVYRRCWLDSLGPRQIEQAFRLVPLLAIASYLYGRGDWLVSPARNDPRFESYARSLARHMDRVARATAVQEALCT
jgi:phosphotransferase family enzyme